MAAGIPILLRAAKATSNQILFGDDLSEPAVIPDELLDEFMHAALEDVVHVTVLKTISHPAVMSLGGALAAIGDTHLIEIAHQVAVTTRQRARQRFVED